MIQMNLFTKPETELQISKQVYGYQRENMLRRDKLGVWN